MGGSADLERGYWRREGGGTGAGQDRRSGDEGFHCQWGIGSLSPSIWPPP